MRRYALRDDPWDRINDILPGREGHVGGTAADNHLFVEAGAAIPRSAAARGKQHGVGVGQSGHAGIGGRGCIFEPPVQGGKGRCWSLAAR